MRNRAIAVAAWAVQLGALLASWLAFSLLTTSLLYGSAPGPLPIVRMAWGVVATLGGFILLRVFREHVTERGGVLAWAVGVAGVWALLGMEAGLPTAWALAAAWGWTRVRGPERFGAWLLRHPVPAWAVLAVLGIELFLQGAAGVVQSSMRAQAPRDVHAGIRVLCIGDSYTFGVGASSHAQAWPAALQRRLAERFSGRTVQVVNGGLPAQNSSILLNHLGELLPTVRPNVVVVCCGVNNRWNLSGLNLAHAERLSRAQQWWILMRQAALHVRLYRACVLAGFRFEDTSLPDAPRFDPSTLPEGIAPITEGTASAAAAEEQVAVLSERVRRDPDDGPAWSELTSACFIAGRTAEALAASDRAIELDPTATHMWRARVHSLIQMGSREAALAACEESLERGCTPLYYPFLAMPACDFDEDKMQAHLLDLGRRRPELRKLLSWIPQNYYGRKRYQDVLRVDLIEMDRRCREAGARMIIHGYPFPGPPNDTLYLTARETGCTFVSHMLAINQALKTATRDDLYVSDGHCTDRGYGIMANNLLPAVLEELKRERIRPEGR